MYKWGFIIVIILQIAESDYLCCIVNDCSLRKNSNQKLASLSKINRDVRIKRGRNNSRDNNRQDACLYIEINPVA